MSFVINTRIREAVAAEAGRAKIGQIHLGLGYTALTLDDGRCGLCHTWIEGKTSCTLFREAEDFEGAGALSLLERIESEDTITRSVVIALVNALNFRAAAACPDDADTLIEDLGLRRGAKLAMIGHFSPVERRLAGAGIQVQSYDIGKGIGDADRFYRWARDEADAAILTATSLINNSTQTVFDHLGPRAIPTALMGPSTVMIPGVYAGFPIRILAGTVPVDTDGILKAIRNGKGTPELLKHARKVYLKI